MTQKSPTNSDLNSALPVLGDRFGVKQQSAVAADRRIPAWALSLFFHCILFGGLFIALSQFQSGAGEVESRTGGIVLAKKSNDETTEYLTDGELESSSETSESADSPPPSTSVDLELAPDLPGMMTADSPITGAGESLIEALPGAEVLIDVPDSNSKIGGTKVTTEVFGVKGTGSRFVYVIDRSKSMDGFGGRPMKAARAELLRSIDSLQVNNQFQIIFYNEGVRIFNPDGIPAMYQATDKSKELAKEFVQRTKPNGGTDHVNALRRAFRLQPDVIFFLTDAEGGFTKRELRIVGDLNRSAAVINAIQFGDRVATPSLQSVARNSGGNFVFKNIRTLKISGN